MKTWKKRFIWISIVLCEIALLVFLFVKYNSQKGNEYPVFGSENTQVQNIEQSSSDSNKNIVPTISNQQENASLEGFAEQNVIPESENTTDQISTPESENTTEQISISESGNKTEQISNPESEHSAEQVSNSESAPSTEENANSKSEEIAKPKPQTEQNRPVICIDPGHYQGVNHVSAENGYEYAEGDFTIKIGLELKRILEEEYGLEVYLTRDSNHITLGGYTDSALDKGHISLRGKYAADMGCDFFISLHTNANNENANGYPTCQQPKEITKTLILANQLCIQSDQWLNVANAIGENVTKANFQLGLCPIEEFERVDAQSVSQWTDAWNDALNTKGTVKCRTTDGREVYGVLRGSYEANVPGIIIEHAYHTVAEMRMASTEQDLALIWARADAMGIVEGLGLQ